MSTKRVDAQQKLLDTLQANWAAEMSTSFIYGAIAERPVMVAQRPALRELATAEKQHADRWANRLQQLGVAVPRFAPSAETLEFLAAFDADPQRSFRSLELEESRDVARYGQQLEQLGDPGSLAILHDLLDEEQEHYRSLQQLAPADAPLNTTSAPEPELEPGAQAKASLDKLLLARQQTGIKAGGWIGDAIYGVNDGLGSIFGIVSGVSGATLGNSRFVLIAGLAGMVASALSMGAGAYLAAKSEREIYTAELAREQRAVALNPVEAREILSLSYQVNGLSPEDADRIVEKLAAHPASLAKALARELLHTTDEGLSSPWTSAVSGALSTAVGALVPILPFFFTSGVKAIVIAACISLAAHFAVGAAKSAITIRSWWSSGWEMTWIGALEGAVTYVIGIALGRIG